MNRVHIPELNTPALKMAGQEDLYQCYKCEFMAEDYDAVNKHARTCSESVKSEQPLQIKLVTGRDVSGVELEDAGTSGEPGNGTSQFEHEWTTAAVLLLIDTYRHYKDKLLTDNTKKKNEIWRDIAKTLQAKGYAVDANTCNTKMRALKRRYKAIKDNANLSVRGAERQWQFYHLMDEVLASSPAVQPVVVRTRRVVASTSGSVQDGQASPSPRSPPPLSPSDSSTPSPSDAFCVVGLLPSLVETDSPSGDPLMQPPRKKAKKTVKASVADNHAVNRHDELLESLVTAGRERQAAMQSFIASMTQQQKMQLNLHREQQKKIDNLQRSIIEMKDEHHQEMKALQEKHIKDLKEQQEKYEVELRRREDRFWEMQRQHHEQLLQLALQRNQQQ